MLPRQCGIKMNEDEPQRIARLTPVDDVLAMIERLVAPVMPRPIEIAVASGRMLADDVFAPGDRPASARALRDGFALNAELIADASSYAPVRLAGEPPRVDVGDPLPES